MENIHQEGTDRHPEIDFDFSTGRFAIRGYSFPENVKSFYDPVVEPLKTYLSGLDGASVNVEFNFIYFHSSTAQVLYRLFDAMEACAEKGNAVTVTWGYEAGDDGMEEAGEDFAEDFERVQFVMREIDPS